MCLAWTLFLSPQRFNSIELVQHYPLLVDLRGCAAVAPSPIVVSYRRDGTLG